MKNNNRMERVNEEIKRELSSIISFELENSLVTGLVSVTKVKTTPDFKFAKVYVSALGSKSKKDVMEGLKKAKGFMRSLLAKRINLRITPDLDFELDETAENGEKIDRILEEINNNNV
jgi:ribosome-binding factor A